MKKVETWNGVRVTFNIPKEAANRLKLLAQQNNDQLKRLGIVSVQVPGEDIVRLSISNTEGNIQNIIASQQSVPLPVNTSALIQHTNDITHGNGHHEFDKILRQLTGGHLQPGTSGYVTSDSNLFVVPQPTTRKRNPRKSKDKSKATNVSSTNNTVNITPNGLTNISNSGRNSQDIPVLTSRMATPSEPAATDALALSDMPNLDLNDLIGADGTPGQLDLEMVNDILHIESMNSQQNPTIGMSPSSLNSAQVQSQLEGSNMNNATHSLTNTSEYNTSEVDELFNLKLQGFEAEDAQSTSHLTPSIGDLQYNHEQPFANVSGPSPVTSHALQRQMSFPQYSSKQGVAHGHNAQSMFTAASGRQSVGPINTGLSSPHHSQQMIPNSVVGPDNGPHPTMMTQGNQKGNMIGHQPDMTGKMFQGNQISDKDGNFIGYAPGMVPGNPDMSMQKQPMNRQGMPNMMQPGNNWKMPMGSVPQHHLQHPAMHRSPGMSSPKLNMNVQMAGSGSYNQVSAAPKRGYPGPTGAPQYPGMQGQPPGGVDGKGLSVTSPLLVKILQTSSNATTGGTSTVTGMAGTQQLSSGVGEPPKPKRKKPQRRKKPSKNSYNPATDPMAMGGPGMMMSPVLQGHIPPQHAGVRQFGPQYGGQQVNSPAQYFHPHGQSPVPQMHPGGMLENPKNLYSPYPNGTNLSSPVHHPMGNKASPGHVFSPEQNTAYIETINRSDVGSRLSSGTPTQMTQHRVPTPGHSPSEHTHITANHMPSSSSNMFMRGGSGTIHHGPRMGGGINGMPGHMQMSPGVRMSQQGVPGPPRPNMRVGVSSPAMQTNQMIMQQFPMQQQQLQFSQHNPQFQSPPPSMNSNTYNQSNTKQPVMMTSPAPTMPNEYNMQQNTPPPNVVINGTDSLQQAIATQRQQMSGYQKHGPGPGNASIDMQDDMSMHGAGTFYHQQPNSSPGQVAMKNPTNPNMFYNATAPMAVAGPNNFNNSNNLTMSSGSILPSGNMLPYSKPDENNMSDATVTHYPISQRPRSGYLDTGEMSILMKGTCNASMTGTGTTKGPSAVPTTLPEVMPHRSPRQGKKSPGSATDGHSSSPGSSQSYTPSPAGAKRNMSTSNPSTPLDPLGSPTTITMQSHSSSRSTTPRPKSACTTPRSRSGTPVANPGTSRRLSIDKQQQNSFSSPQQRGQPQGMTTPSPVGVNGPSILNRPLSRADSSSQQYMTPPGTPAHSHQNIHNPKYHGSGLSGPGVPSPRMTNQGTYQPAHGPQYYNAPPAYPGEKNFSHQQHQHQQVTDTNTLIKTLTPSEGPPKPHWGHTVSNHLPSPGQTNSAHKLDETVQFHQQTMPNLSASRSANNHTQLQNCYNSTSATQGVSPKSTDAASPCVSVSESVQNPCRTEKPFFNNQTQDLISKKQQETSAATVPLQS